MEKVCVLQRHAASLVGKVASYVSKTEVFHKLFGNGALATSRGTHDNAVQHLSLHLYTINGLIKVEWPLLLIELCGSTSNLRIVSSEYAFLDSIVHYFYVYYLQILFKSLQLL